MVAFGLLLGLTTGHPAGLAPEAQRLDDVRPFLTEAAHTVVGRQLTEMVPTWTTEVLHGAATAAGAGASIDAMVDYWVAHRAELEGAMRARLAATLPELTRAVVREGMSRHGDVEAGAAATRGMGDVGLATQAPLEELSRHWFDATVGRMAACLHSRTPDDGCPLPTGIDPTDLRATIDRYVQPSQLVELFKKPLAEAIGTATVDQLQTRLDAAVKGELPPEVHDYLMTPIRHFQADMAMVEQYLPGAQLDQWRQKLMGMEIVHLPNAVYGGVLTASALRHFAKVFCGPGCINFYELNRGREVSQFLVWQLKNREGIALTVGQFLDLVQYVGTTFNIPDPRTWGKFGRDLAAIQGKVQDLEGHLRKVDDLYTEGVTSTVARTEQIVGEFEGHLKELQAKLLAPVREAIEMTEEGFGVIRKKMKQFVTPWDEFMQKVKAFFKEIGAWPKADICLSTATPGFAGGGRRCEASKLFEPRRPPPGIDEGRDQRQWPTDHCVVTGNYYGGLRRRGPTADDRKQHDQRKRQEAEGNPPPAAQRGGVGVMKGRYLGKDVQVHGTILHIDKRNHGIERIFVDTIVYLTEIDGETGRPRETEPTDLVLVRHDGGDVRARMEDQLYATEPLEFVRLQSKEGYAGEVIFRTTRTYPHPDAPADVQRRTPYYLHYVHAEVDGVQAEAMKEFDQVRRKSERKEEMTEEEAEVLKHPVRVAAGDVVAKSNGSGTPDAHLHLRTCFDQSGSDCFAPTDYLPFTFDQGGNDGVVRTEEEIAGEARAREVCRTHLAERKKQKETVTEDRTELNRPAGDPAAIAAVSRASVVSVEGMGAARVRTDGAVRVGGGRTEVAGRVHAAPMILPSPSGTGVPHKEVGK